MQPDLTAAIDFATNAHRGQFRDGDCPLPYITHPLDVLANVRYVGEVTDPAVLCAAVLHDVVEESPVEPDEIEVQFGPDVRQLVQELTRQEPNSEQIQGMTKEEIWELRSSMLLEEIGQMSRRAQTVKLGDRLSNLREARRTKESSKLHRYNRQTAKILEIIPKEANPGLWNAVRELQQEIASSQVN